MFARKLCIAFGAILAAWLLAPSPAQAACASLGSCTCTVTATPVSFGSYNPVATGTNDSAGTVRVICTLVASLAGSFTVDLSTGTSNSYAARTLRGPGGALTYNLYTNAARSLVWGNGTGGTDRVTYSFTAALGVDQSFTVYGRIPAGQNVAPGLYSDTITVTVTY